MQLTCCCQSDMETEDEEQTKADGMTGRSLTSSEKIHRLMEQLGCQLPLLHPPPSTLHPYSPSFPPSFSQGSVGPHQTAPSYQNIQTQTGSDRTPPGTAVLGCSDPPPRRGALQLHTVQPWVGVQACCCARAHLCADDGFFCSRCVLIGS